MLYLCAALLSLLLVLFGALTFYACSSQISAMELQISDLKEQLDKEHQKWRAAQTNYERQVKTSFFTK